MQLPKKDNLRIDNLSTVFKFTTNSYKFYWFLAILKNVKKGKTKINIDDLIIDMIAEVWYPINYFKLSFGLQDQFNITIRKIQITLDLPNNITKQELEIELKKQIDLTDIKDLIRNLSRWVPHRFIRPWFSNELRGCKDSVVNSKIIELSKERFTDINDSSLYKLNKDDIEINKNWFSYLQKHLRILTDFTHCNLVLFLQNRNPNVGNIPVKLFPPMKRDLSKARIFWDTYLQMNEMSCIYSNITITTNEYSIDHFLPWSFTGHDQLWNLIPTLQSVNSSKSDNLPCDEYIQIFTSIQYNAFHDVLSKTNQISLLEDYTILFNTTIEEIKEMKKEVFTNRLIDNIKPQIQIAENMGFCRGWKYNLES